MDIHNKTKEQLIAELLNLQEQNSKLKNQLDSFTDLKNTEELLLNSEHEIKNNFTTLSSIFESTQNIIIFSLDTNYCYTAFTNLHKKTMKLIWGVEIALGMNMLELIQLPADRKKAKDNFDKVLSGEYLRFEEEYGDVNLFRTYYEDTYNPIIDNNGNVVGLSVFVVDITDRKNAENKNERTQKLLEESQRIGKIGGWEFNIETKELLWTREMYSIHEVDSTHIPMAHKRIDFYTPETLEIIDNAVKQAIETGEFYEVEVEIITAKGNRRIIRTTGEADLKNRKLFGYYQDITDRKQAEKAMMKSEEKYRLITEFTADVVWVFNITTGKFTYISPSVYQLRGFTAEEAVNQTLEDSIAPYSIGIVKDTIAIHISNFIEQPEAPNYYINEIQQNCKNGDVIWVEISSQYRYNPSGEIEVVGVSRNIEKRKKAEQELKESEEKYKFIIDNAIEGMYRTSIDGKALMANKASAEMLGYASAEEFLNEMNDSAHQVWLIPEQRAEYTSILDEQGIIQGYECQMKKKDGTPIWVSLNAKIARDDLGNKIYYEGFAEEITNRKNAEIELIEAKEKAERNENYFRRIIATVPSMIYDYVLYPDGSNKFLFVSDNCKEILEINANDLLADMNLFWKLVHDDDLQKLKQDDFEANKTGKVFSSEVRITTPSGKHKWIELCSRPNPPINEQPVIWSGYILDITCRKLAEQALKESEDKYRESQLIGNVAHWEYNFETQKLYWSDQLYKIYELSKENFKPDLKKSLAASHIDDQETIRKTYFDSIQNKSNFGLMDKINAGIF